MTVQKGSKFRFPEVELRKKKEGNIRDLWHSLLVGGWVLATILIVEHMIDYVWDDDPVEVADESD